VVETGTPIKYDGIQIDERPHFQRITWWIERVGWVFFVLFVIAALVGVFGSGALGRGKASGPGFILDYERFSRQNASSSLVVHFASPPTGSNNVEIWISQRFIQGIQLQQVIPDPSDVSSSGDWFVYSIATQPGISGTFELDFVHQSQWNIPIRVGLSPQQAIEVTEFVWP
jgi:hypothetical protein